MTRPFRLSTPGTWLGMVALVTLLLAGCNTSDTGPADSFRFIQVAAPSSDFAEQREKPIARIQEAITQAMEEKGVQRAESMEADVIVAFLIIVQDNVSTAALDTYFGYGRDADKLQSKAHKDVVVKGTNPEAFQSGTLVIDILDPDTYKVIYRGTVTREILRNVPDDVRLERLQEAVDEALADYAQ